MAPLFLDASYLLAVQLSDDVNHAVASRHWETLAENVPPLLTSSFILNEVVTFLNSRGRHDAAVEVGDDLMNNPDIEFVFVDLGLFRKGWSLFLQRPDKSYSLTDCISFTLMKDRGIVTALAFDRHFAQAGFFALPEGK